MARIPDTELDELKRSTDLAALVRSKGIELKPHGGKDLAGLSPFTDEKTPSFIVTPGKNLWHCMSSGKGGSVVDFVMHYDGVSFRQAVELLKSQSPQLYRSGGPVKKSTVPKLPPPVQFNADDEALFSQVLDYYGERLKENPAAVEYLKKRGLWNAVALERFKIGFADRTLGLTLPHKNRKDGAEIRTKLTRLGIYRESGHEHFNGSLVFPILDEAGNVSEIYGRKVGKQKSGINHLYLPGPHRGIWNPDCLKSPEIVLTESVIDALTFWVNGFENVTCIYGTEGFTDDHLEAFKKHKTQKIYLAYDRDKAGDRAATRDAERLQSIGVECFRVRFPAGHDANEYALKVTPGNKSLQALLNGSEWLGKGAIKGRRSSSYAPQEDQATSSKIEDSESNDAPRAPSSLVEIAAKERSDAVPPQGERAERVGANLAADARGDGEAAKENKTELKPVGEDYTLDLGDPSAGSGQERSYRVRGLQKNGSLEVLKVNLRLSCRDLFHLDTLDFYRAKDREAFIRAAANETTLEPELIKRDMGKLLLALESLQEQRIRTAMESHPETVELSTEEEAEAMELLKSPDLLGRILEDFDACGIVGEATNKLTGYLSCVSRQLDRPLAVIIQSTSAAGKSTLMEAILALMPKEEQVKYSAMTGQSLYYLGETNLKHKILAIVEEEGAEKASYALKLLQSEGELTIASTGKDDQGRMKTEEYHVEGPVMIFLTTTAVDIDEELLNRCLVLTVDESREQTEAIHRLQRERRTAKGLAMKRKRASILQAHHNAQRLLRPIDVQNPYADALTFRSDRTRLRRDHEKYLSLIDTIALLHQYQRPVRKDEAGGRFVEATLSDIEAANKIAHEVLGRSLDELPPQTRRLLTLLKEWVGRQCGERNLERSDFHFSRRQLREAFGWGDTQLKVHLSRLLDMEYLELHRLPGQSGYFYELLYDGEGGDGSRFLSGLLDPASLKYRYDGERSGCGRPPVGDWSAGGRSGEIAADASHKKASESGEEPEGENAQEPRNRKAS